MDNKNKNRKFEVTNRSGGRVHYEIPELGIKSRDYAPGETKQISYAELEALSYLPGGLTLIREYLLVQDITARDEIVGSVEPEYNMTKDQVLELIKHGTMEEWLDCLDFAPEGVIDLVRELSIELPLTDMQKIKAFSEKKNVNLAKAIEEREAEKAEALAAAEEKPTARRTTAATTAAPATRRTTGEQYKVVNIKA